MQIVIDIPEEMWKRIKYGYVPLGISKYLKNGTPLPKGHGRLIDADDLFDNTCIDEIPTIIEADKPESEDKE